ncbi:hypothetical protein SAMN02982929_05303 [Saccharopolyspora kobensis]|uniref:Tail assembly chaperone n=1 Tax=Saccharopolyspora kobensis TaxID=146035 RepID=A0A1H6DZU8_9PSEU|nr:hypothetical protein [Saccharopolyspora kobensis]SEG90741.1 hypothetical protein SAMN02982929_05303 [Saccharopolyspora kobensis]SFD93547.1 hypothetical protein SAMN05216506_107279 [Saccharopolyspora kobensis]
MAQPLSREAILAADDSNVEDVPVPQWGGTVRVRSLTGRERDRLEASMIGKNGKADATRGLANFRARLVAASVIDENGAPMFTEADVDALAGKSAAALDVIASAAMRLSGLSDSDVEELAGE